MALAPGTRLGAYEIATLIGVGGMGEVYRARDARLQRDVAIKVLPSDVRADRDRLARFEREAQVLASLDHPNIAHIHGVDDSAGVPALIMELVEGPTLADRIAKGPIPVDEALPIAKQIAEALEAAHEHGIIHRDLKPANIKVRADGTVKVLDFGLAKAFDPVASGSGNATMSPTLTIHATQAGLILGTAAYMAPEQAAAKPTDKRADIWSYGLILWEMLTGQRMFEGETVSHTLADVLRAPIDLARLPASIPRPIRDLVGRCLERDVKYRLRDIGEARVAIDRALSGGERPEVARSSQTGLGPRWVAPAALTLAAVATAIAVALIASPRARDGEQPVMRVELSLPDDVELFVGGGRTVALSPDGRSLAFVGVHLGGRQIYVRRLDQSDATPLRGTEGAFTCFFSPDGAAIGFVSTNGSLRRVSLADGLIATVAASGGDNTGSQTWGPDGRITLTFAGTLWNVPAAGGTVVPLTKLASENGELAHVFPTATDSGNVLFTALSSKRAERIEAISPQTSARHVVVESAAFPLGLAGNYLVFSRDQGLWAAPFDRRAIAVTSVPVRVVDRVSIAADGSPIASLSKTGSLLYSTGTTEASTLVWVSRRGEQVPVTDTRRLYLGPRVSPDGRRIVVQATGDLWILDLERATFTRLTSPATFSNSFPIWTPDGKRVIFRTAVGIHWIDVDRIAAAHRLPDTTSGDFPTSVSPDGDTVLEVHQTADAAPDLYALSLSGKSPPRPIVSTAAFEGGGMFSPDGRWITYVSDESGQRQVYVRPWQGERRWQVSTAGGTSPVWNRNGRELFYRDGNKIMAVDVTAGADLTLSTPHLLFEHAFAYGPTITIPNYDVTPDGQRFLLVQDEPEARRFEFVLNWLHELKTRAPMTK